MFRNPAHFQVGATEDALVTAEAERMLGLKAYQFIYAWMKTCPSITCITMRVGKRHGRFRSACLAYLRGMEKEDANALMTDGISIIVQRKVIA